MTYKTNDEGQKNEKPKKREEEDGYGNDFNTFQPQPFSPADQQN